MYCNDCSKYRKFNKTNIYIYIYIYILKKTASLSIAYIKCGRKYENIFKEEESIEMLKIPNLINNIDEYQKIYNHV